MINLINSYVLLPCFCLVLAVLCWSIVGYRQLQLFQVALSYICRSVRSEISYTLWSSFGLMTAICMFWNRFTLYLSISGQLFVISSFLYIWFDKGATYFYIPDHLSFSLVALTVFIFLLSFGLLAKEVHRNLAFWCGLLFILEGFLLLAFLVDNMLLFYVSFEGTLLPMYLLIGAWGSRSRKIKANYYFFLYTLFGSLFTLLGLLLLYWIFGTFSYSVLFALIRIVPEVGVPLAPYFEHWIWLFLSLGFFAKLPVFLFHLWLPEAHVEAPTVGSIILAAILLKLGFYGFVRLPFSLFPSSTAFWLPIVLPIVSLGAVYTAAVAAVQDDFKKIIAYSSISHMALALIGLLTGTVDGSVGAFSLAVGHGLTSGGLFAFAGVLYDRYHTRDLKYFGGLLSSMPYAGFLFTILVLGNVGFPFLCNFPGEFLIIAGSLQFFGGLTLIFILSFFLTAVYSFRLINLFFFGSLKPQYIHSSYDLTRMEYVVLSLFSLSTVSLGLFCAPLIQLFEGVVNILL